MMKLVLAAAMIAAAAPVVAHTAYQPTEQDFREGRCVRQQVHVPAGKIVHAPPIVRCDDAAMASRVAARDHADGETSRGTQVTGQ